VSTTRTLPKLLCCSMYCLFCVVLCFVVCKCVLYYCHRVTTQLQLTNISISISISKSNLGKKTGNIKSYPSLLALYLQHCSLYIKHILWLIPSSSKGSASLVSFGLLNYRWVFSAGRFLQSAVVSDTSNPQPGGPVIRTFQLSPQGVTSVWNDASEPQ